MKPEEIIELLNRQSEKIEMPKNFKGDILRDAGEIDILHLRKFIWVLRENGTELYPLTAMPFKIRKAKQLWISVTVKSHPEARGFLFSRGEFKEIDLKRTFRRENI